MMVSRSPCGTTNASLSRSVSWCASGNMLMVSPRRGTTMARFALETMRLFRVVSSTDTPNVIVRTGCSCASVAPQDFVDLRHSRVTERVVGMAFEVRHDPGQLPVHSFYERRVRAGVVRLPSLFPAGDQHL